MGKGVIEPGKLYLYLSADGVTRQRCGRHVHTEPWGRPVRIWSAEKPTKRRTCIECYHERFGTPEKQGKHHEAQD